MEGPVPSSSCRKSVLSAQGKVLKAGFEEYMGKGCAKERVKCDGEKRKQCQEEYEEEMNAKRQ